MRITTKGQVTIPQHLRELYGFMPHTEVEFIEDGGGLRLHKVDSENRRMRAWIDRAKGSADIRLTTDEIMALTRGDD